MRSNLLKHNNLMLRSERRERLEAWAASDAPISHSQYEKFARTSDVQLHIGESPDSGFAARPGMTLAAITVFGLFADVLDGHHMLVFGGVEHDDALGRAAGNPDALDRTADQLALVGHQHDLVGVLDRE
jgi:hypothetical protein